MLLFFKNKKSILVLNWSKYRFFVAKKNFMLQAIAANGDCYFIILQRNRINNQMLKKQLLNI